ncbi:MAG: hypothetical protein B7Z55_03680 [Planctomycetales bacterium 12-60-4]|nr:MAG: hypothetical protein B7Z55_03680 [Planctomycetales bacterium 12-60-4]
MKQILSPVPGFHEITRLQQTGDFSIYGEPDDLGAEIGSTPCKLNRIQSSDASHSYVMARSESTCRAR